MGTGVPAGATVAVAGNARPIDVFSNGSANAAMVTISTTTVSQINRVLTVRVNTELSFRW